MNPRGIVWLKISGVSGIIAPIIIFAMILLAISYSPQFSWTENALSDLGVQEGFTAPLFNYGLMVGGFLAFIFASGLFIFLHDNALGRIGNVIFALDTVALIAIGVFPENVKPTHYQVSVAFFALYPISMLVMGTSFLLTNKVKIGLFTFLTATVAAAVWIVYFSTYFVHGVAVPEAVSALSALTWSIVLGFLMLKEASLSNK
jgi:hypothetical membrane protein